jgi:hypothetical protein
MSGIHVLYALQEVSWCHALVATSLEVFGAQTDRPVRQGAHTAHVTGVMPMCSTFYVDCTCRRHAPSAVAHPSAAADTALSCGMHNTVLEANLEHLLSEDGICLMFEQGACPRPLQPQCTD